MAGKQSSFAEPCKIGTYQSKSHSSTCDDCVASAYCDESGMAKVKNCPEGHYCPAKTIKPKACPEGTFNDLKSQDHVSDCKNCTAGYYCEGTRLIIESGKCMAGYYCIRRSPYRNPVRFLCLYNFFSIMLSKKFFLNYENT